MTNSDGEQKRKPKFSAISIIIWVGVSAMALYLIGSGIVGMITKAQ